MDKPLRGLIAGVLVALVVVIFLAVRDVTAPTAAEKRRNDAKEFISKWRASRFTYYRAIEHFQRKRNGKVVLQRSVIIDQDPPRYVSKNSTGSEIILPGRLINCFKQKQKEPPVCSQRNYVSWDAMVAREVSALQGYFFSSAPIYQVKKDGKCFNLEDIYPEYPSPPYGMSSRFCFNRKGILTKFEIVHSKEFQDISTFDNIKLPSNADFVVPKDIVTST
jgi:hypothetical protein